MTDHADEIDWEALRARARELCARAYAPYSQFPVGAGAPADDGRVVAGCNGGDGSYGGARCAARPPRGGRPFGCAREWKTTRTRR